MGKINVKNCEGATPLYDYSDLLLPWVQSVKDLNRVEAENITIAKDLYLKQNLAARFLKVRELKTIHKAMFGNVWNWAGKYRKTMTSIGVEPHLIPMRLAELCVEVNAWAKEPLNLTIVERAARLHHRLVSIHPFENGNGRISRFMADRYLLAWGAHHPIWPQKISSECQVRKIYINALKSADKGDYDPLVAFMDKLITN